MWLSKGKVVLAVSLSKVHIKRMAQGRRETSVISLCLAFLIAWLWEFLHIACRVLGEFWGAYDSSGNAQAPAAEAWTHQGPGGRRCCGYLRHLPDLIFCHILRLQLTFCYFCSAAQCHNNWVCKYCKLQILVSKRIMFFIVTSLFLIRTPITESFLLTPTASKIYLDQRLNVADNICLR